MTSTRHDIKHLGIPRIKADGSGVELLLITENGEDIALTIPSGELINIIDPLMRALTSAKITRSLRQTGEGFKPTPALYHAEEVAFLTQPSDEIGYVVAQTAEKVEVQLCVQWPQLRALVEMIQGYDNLQIAPDIDETSN